jgi:hypothetical protein
MKKNKQVKPLSKGQPWAIRRGKNVKKDQKDTGK